MLNFHKIGYTSHSGHYYSYVRGPNDIWYKADDTQITTVRTQEALNQNAYILFYNRVPTTVTPPTKNQIPLTKQPVCFPLPPPFLHTPNQSQSAPVTSFPLKQHQQSGNETSSLKHIPENNKFKSTFTPLEAEPNTNKTLNYDQVLKIKSLNKRKLKLINKKKKLKNLKHKKKSLANDATNEHDLKKLKKQIHKTKKLIRQEKSKIKKLKRYESCSSDQSDEDSDSSTSKRKLTESYKDSKRAKTTNSLSLLKQYSSSESSDEALSTQSSPMTSSRSSSRSNSSDSSSVNSHKQFSTPPGQQQVTKQETSHLSESLSVKNDENYRPSNRSYSNNDDVSLFRFEFENWQVSFR